MRLYSPRSLCFADLEPDFFAGPNSLKISSCPALHEEVVMISEISTPSCQDNCSSLTFKSC
ncbi:hypothetical protein DPMN_148829 [Dreissena polymorpha]|uniref:Uncharacterized protein n=1 Tax=Dreissena polymorpha TaxID=45954 RepID=A0A9D4FAM2_DREPO|nr:hypothetical protein DPMN_148829 [Dreissena polymorpha]